MDARLTKIAKIGGAASLLFFLFFEKIKKSAKLRLTEAGDI